MKKYIFLLLAGIALSLSARSQGHKIEFNIQGVSSGDCILAHYYADQNRIVDTAEVSPNGKVVFEGEDKLLNGIYLLVIPNRTYIELVIPEDDQEFRIDFDTTLSVMNKKVYGSNENSIFLEFDQFAHEASLQMRALKDREDAAKTDKEKEKINEEKAAIDQAVKDKRLEIIEKHPTSFVAAVFQAGLEVRVPEELDNDTTGKRFLYYREHYWDNINLKEDGLIRTPLFHRKLQYYFTKLHVQIADSIIPAIDMLAGKLEEYGSDELFKYTVWWTTKHYEESKLMCMDRMLWHMASNYYCAGRCFWADSALVNKMCEHAGKIGPTLCNEVAPDLTLVDTTFVREYTLSKIEYPVTIVVFWDPECGHCKKEVPKLQELYDSMNSKGVQIYAVYTQGDWKGWKKYIQDNGLTWINVMDAFNKSNFREKYHIISTPQVIVLDEFKKIRFKNAPAENLYEICDLLIDEYKERHPELDQK